MNSFNFNKYIKDNLLLKEEADITLNSDLSARLASDASKKLTIPKGAKVTVVKKRLDNEPTVTQLKYDGKLVNVNAGNFDNQYSKEIASNNKPNELKEEEDNEYNEMSNPEILSILEKIKDVYSKEDNQNEPAFVKAVQHLQAAIEAINMRAGD